MKIAIEGCAHGELDNIYKTIEIVEEKEKIKIDLLICCGDFQATRNKNDLNTMAVPEKYRKMCSFYKYYTGEKVAPVLTLFIGGNHEASNHLQELPYGGWAAPNIYYLGYAGVVTVRDLRIAGISGIFKAYDYNFSHFEKPPYNSYTIRSVYHIRNLEVFRLKQMKSPIDIFLSHDWPRGICNYGNKGKLVRNKPFLKADIDSNSLGSPPCEELLHHLKPRYWFSAHLHCKFSALVVHEEEDKTESEEKRTKFLALDKCIPGRKFLQVLDIPCDDSKPLELRYDLEWLTILHFTNHLTNVKRERNHLPSPGCDERYIFTPTDEEMDFILRKLQGDLRVPLNFTDTTVRQTESPRTRNGGGPSLQNPQTADFCQRIGIDDPSSLFDETVPSVPSTPDKSFSDQESTFIDSSRDDSFGFNCDSDEESGEESTVSGMKDEPKPKERQSLILPPPKFSESLPDNSEDAVNHRETENNKLLLESYDKSDPSEDNSSLFVIDISPKRPLETETCQENGKKLKGKLKRRNQELYAANIDG